MNVLHFSIFGKRGKYFLTVRGNVVWDKFIFDLWKIGPIVQLNFSLSSDEQLILFLKELFAFSKSLFDWCVKYSEVVKCSVKLRTHIYIYYFAARKKNDRNKKKRKKFEASFISI